MKTKMHLRASSHLWGYARILRRNPTQAEILLWERLRANQTGFKFRRQHPICNYIVDFFCYSLMYVIEVDGSIHLKAVNQLEDENKDLNLNSYGIYIQRFTNEQVIYDIENVMVQIHTSLSELQLKMLAKNIE